MRPEIDFAGRAIQGSRDDQEDYYAFEVIDDERLLLVLADGAGGQTSGELASRQAAMGFLDAFADTGDAALPNLNDALMLANRRLAEFMDRDSKRTGMATTLAAVMIDGARVNWISVGDSPLLLFRGGKISRLNEDHSGMGDPSGKLARNILRSALVGGRIPLIDWRREPFALEEGDVLLLASDGIWTLTSDQIAEVVVDHRKSKASEMASALIEAIQKRKKLRQDNATVAVIKR